MYEIAVNCTFNATHAVTVGGVGEELHDHDWYVVATVAGESLDEEGLLIDFLELQRLLNAAVAPLRNANLAEALSGENPSAERVARFIGARLDASLPSAAVSSICVTEAPGCIATWRP